MSGFRIHCADIRQVDNYRLVAQVFHGHITQMKVNSFDKHIGTDDRLVFAKVDYRCIVTNSFFGAFELCGYRFG